MHVNKRSYVNSNRHVTRLTHRRGVIWECLEKEPGKGWAGWTKDLTGDKGLGGD